MACKVNDKQHAIILFDGVCNLCNSTVVAKNRYRWFGRTDFVSCLVRNGKSAFFLELVLWLALLMRDIIRLFSHYNIVLFEMTYGNKASSKFT